MNQSHTRTPMRIKQVDPELLRLATKCDALVAALRDLIPHCNNARVFSGKGVKGVREAGKFMGVLTRAKAVLAAAEKE